MRLPRLPARHQSVYASAIGLACLLYEYTAFAELSGGEGVAAQVLFDQARQLVRENKFSEACPKFEESQRLDPGSGTLINLADCYEKLGRNASAWNMFLQAASGADTTGNSERAREARERAAALEPRLARIAIAVAGASSTPSLVVTRDGAVVGPAQWDLAIPVDPGIHEVSAAAPGRKTWVTSVTLSGEGALASLEIPELQPLPEVPSAATPQAPASKVVLVANPTSFHAVDNGSRSLSAQRTGALVAAGLGVVGVSIGSYFGFRSKSARDDAEPYCDGDECWSQRGVELKSDALRAGNLSTALFTVGAVGLACGAVLWFTEPTTQSAPATRVGLGPGYISIRGQL